MNMMDILMKAGGGAGVDALAQQFGLNKSQVDSVLGAVLPNMSAGFQRQAQDKGGLGSLLKQLQGTGYENYHQNPGALSNAQARDDGNSILGQIFGSKDVSREVARRASQSSGVSDSVIKQMLPVIASVVMGGMQRQTTTNRGMGGMLDTLIKGMSGASQTSPSGGGGLNDLIGAVLGGGASAQPQPQAPRKTGGLGGLIGSILGGGSRKAPQPQTSQTMRFDPSAMGLGAPRAQRRSTGNSDLDGLINMFDADGDGKVDSSVIDQFLHKR